MPVRGVMRGVARPARGEPADAACAISANRSVNLQVLRVNLQVRVMCTRRRHSSSLPAQLLTRIGCLPAAGRRGPQGLAAAWETVPEESGDSEGLYAEINYLTAWPRAAVTGSSLLFDLFMKSFLTDYCHLLESIKVRARHSALAGRPFPPCTCRTRVPRSGLGSGLWPEEGGRRAAAVRAPGLQLPAVDHSSKLIR